MKQRRSVCGIAVQKGLFLVAQRNEGGSQGGKWEFPGGKLEEGETPQRALHREFLEELGVPVQVGKKLCETQFQNGPHTYLLEAWAVELAGQPSRLSEHQELRWLELPAVLELDLSMSDRNVAEFLKNGFKGPAVL
ncbi:MAG: NUDIX domain-containing protein [Spirochaetales bacterium]|nr:NUDIX domain-containing protein [Spirochaetales bacterium]